MSRSVDPNHDPALTFFLLLRMVTPIDHFLLILSRPHRIDVAAVAKAQQIMPHGRHMPMPKKRIIFYSIGYKRIGLLEQLPLGKLLTRFCEDWRACRSVDFAIAV
jgi:hypothetical protein